MNDLPPHNPVTGEIIDDDADERGMQSRAVIAADGKPVAKRSGHLSDVLRLIDDGQFNADASEDMRKLVLALQEHAKSNKGIAKGSITIKMDFTLANGILVTTPDVSIKTPKVKRDGTALFIGEEGTLGRNPENQQALFGDRAPRDPFAERQAIRDIHD